MGINLKLGENMGQNDHVELSVEFRKGTEKAILVFDGTKDAWIPKSQLKEGLNEDVKDGDQIQIEIPEWLAINNNLV